MSPDRSGGAGYKKVGHKARNGVKPKNRGRSGHKGHRARGRITDSVTKGIVRVDKLRARKAREKAAPTVEEWL